MTRLNSLTRRFAAMSRPRRYGIAAAAAAAVLALAGASTLLATQPGAHHEAAAGHSGRLRLSAEDCSGPTGAAYVADAGYQAFTAIDTANCTVIQSYNVGDTSVPGDSSDTNYSGTDEGIALHGSNLYFAVTGDSQVAVIDTATLNPSNYSPAETLINVGLFPQDLAVSPDGSQLWVADTGPQTSPSSPSGIAVISTATNKVTAKMRLQGQPSQVTFSPSGAEAYVVTSSGVAVFDTATMRQVGEISGVGQPHGIAVSPDGKTVYVADTTDGTLDVVNASTDQVAQRIQVGQLPWAVTLSADGDTAYVANADSDSVSVINTVTGAVTHTVTVAGDPDALALTPDGTQLWVGEQAGGEVTVIDTATDADVGVVDLGGTAAQSGDGLEPTGLVLTTTPTPGS
jgi:phospholipase C